MRSTIRMPSLCRIAGLLVVVGLAASWLNTVSADEASAPSVKVVLSGADEFLKDVKFLLGLTNEQEKKQEIVLKDYLENVFFIGIDRKLPVCLDVKFGNPSTRLVWSLPVDNFNNFRNVNLKGMSIISKQKGVDLYELSSTFKGWMKFDKPYANVGEQQGDLPAADPRTSLKDLLAKNFDAAAEARNTKIDAESQAGRRKNFANTRKELLGALKKGKDETDASFVLKKKLFEFQLDEGERFFAESERLMLGWTTDGDKKQGRLDVELVPIAGTSLEKAVSGLGTSPSYFANIERSAKPILSGRLNHPLDEQRKKSLADLAGTLRDRAKSAVDTATDLSAEEKTATKKITDQVFEMLTAGTNAGIMDGFVEVHANDSGKNTLVCGFRTADGAGVVEILKNFPQSRKGRQVKLDADKEGDVKIHEVTVAETDQPNYQAFFSGPNLYVGSSKEAVWCATGENALAELKGAIKKRAEAKTPPADAPFGQIYVKLLPWIKLREDRDPKQGSPKLRKIALEAFSQGDDIVSGEIRNKDKKIVGQLIVETGILRFAGKAAADFSRENLDDSQPQPKKGAAAKK